MLTNLRDVTFDV